MRTWAQRGHETGPTARTLMLILLGAIAATGQAPLGLWPLTLMSLALAMWLLTGVRSRRRVMLFGMALGGGYFAAAMHWIIEPFLVDIERYGWMAPFALVFMALGGGAFWAAGLLAGRWIGRGRLGPVTVASGLMLAEITRSYVFTGFPWALIGHVWINTPVAYVSALTGPHGLTGLAFVTALVLTCGGMAGRLVAAGAMALILGLGSWIPVMAPNGDAPIIRLVQPNAAQHLKWAPGMAEMFFENQVTMTGAPGAPDVIVWPETSLPYDLGTSSAALSYVADAAAGAPVILGGLRWEGRAYFNSLAVVTEGGTISGLYDKSHLVPFGEYIPWVQTFARLGLTFGLVAPGEGYSSGPGLHLVDVPGLGAVLPLICYEGIFAEEVNGASGRARAIVLITNDAWFGNWAGPAQHFAQARLRAIEQGLPVIRVANTGISGVINATGQVIGQIPLNTQGYLDIGLPAAHAATLYSHLGDRPVIGLVIIIGLLQYRSARRKGVDPAGTPS